MGETLRIYVRLKRAYRKHGVAHVYSRREVWEQAKFSVRMMRFRDAS